MAHSYVKNPNEDKTISIDFTDELNGETISSVSWSSDLTEDSVSNTDTVAKITVSGGVNGLSYSLLATVTTSAGNTAIKSVSVIVSEEPAEAADGLTTVARVALEMGITDEAELYRIAQLILDATDMIALYCNRSTFKRQEVVEKFVGNGRNLAFVNHLPIVSISSITMDGVTIPSTDYEIQGSASGGVFHFSGWQDTAYDASPLAGMPVAQSRRKMFEITYTGGYILPSVAGRDLPRPIEQACLQLVKSMYNQGDNKNIKSEKVDSVYQVEYREEKMNNGIPSDVASLLDPYVRPVL